MEREMKSTIITIEPKRAAEEKFGIGSTMASALLGASREQQSRDNQKMNRWNNAAAAAAVSSSRTISKGGVPSLSRLSLCFLAVMFAAIITPGAAQLGSTICSCSPPIFEITFDFSVTCNDTNVANNTGVAEAECNVSPFQGGVAIDETPVVISTIDVVELDRFNDVLKSSSVFQEFQNGDTFTYVTTSANVSAPVSPTTVVGGWQISMIGSNAQQQPLLLMWIIKFTNDCNSYPVIVPGNKIAWTVFTNLTAPNGATCPAINSKSPTSSPTLSPGLVPTPSLPTAPSTPTSPPPTPVAPPSDGGTTQPPDGCYWVGPAYPKGGKGKGGGSKGSYSSYRSGKSDSKGSSGPKTKSKKSKKSSKTPPIAKGKGGGVVEDVFAEPYEAENQESMYYYDYDYGDYYWCPPGYGTIAPSWPKGGGSGDYSKPTGSDHNPRPMHMHTAASSLTQSSPNNMLIGSNGVGGLFDYDANNDGNIVSGGTAPEQAGIIYSQNTPPVDNNNYWAAPPSDTATTTTGGDGGIGGDVGYSSPYFPGGSSSHPDGSLTGQGVYFSPPTTSSTTSTTTSGYSSSSPGTATMAILIAAVAGGSVLALVMGFVLRRKLIHGDDYDDDQDDHRRGDKVVVETQVGDDEDHSVSTISQHGDGGGGSGGNSNGLSGTGGSTGSNSRGSAGSSRRSSGPSRGGGGGGGRGGTGDAGPPMHVV